jgi:hypothetical protein
VTACARDLTFSHFSFSHCLTMGSGFFSFVILVLATVWPAIAAPSRPVAFGRVSKRDSGVAALSADALAAFAPFTQFARAAYCDSGKIVHWTCGKACDALPGFEPTLTGGDGDGVQLCTSLSCPWPTATLNCARAVFVGYWPSQNTIIVSHEGTDPLAL